MDFCWTSEVHIMDIDEFQTCDINVFCTEDSETTKFHLNLSETNFAAMATNKQWTSQNLENTTKMKIEYF